MRYPWRVLNLVVETSGIIKLKIEGVHNEFSFLSNLKDADVSSFA